MSITLVHSRSTTIPPRLDKRTTSLRSRWLLPSALIIGATLAAALIGATFGTPATGALSEAVVTKAFSDSRDRGAVYAVETMKIVPADSLRAGLSWTPLTGDGSN